ncbi:MAG: CAP domain-containing protein [Myxococcales bacterium]|nr:CAP domain-containing protein [Myxococcales bacterium]
MVRRAAVVIVLAACAGAPVAPAPVAPAPSEAGPRGAPADRAGPPVAPVLDEVRAAATARGQVERAVPRLDPALDEVARVAAMTASATYVVGATELREAMAAQVRSGLDPHVLTARGDDLTVRAQLVPALAELRAQAGVATVGVAEAGVGADRVVAVVAMPPPSQPIAIEQHGAIARVVVPWTWAAPPHAFDVTTTTTRRVPVTAAMGEARLEVDCAGGGTRAIELDAGERLVARVVNVCGPLTPLAAGAVELGPPAATAVEIEERLFELLNRERVAAGLVAVIWDPQAHALARRHAGRMAALGFLGHVAPDGETLADRVARAGLPARETFENVGLADGPARVHVAFMASPGHRHNLLAERARQGAVGLAPAPRAPGTFYVTQLLFEPL